jgi:hypothetical protein
VFSGVQSAAVMLRPIEVAILHLLDSSGDEDIFFYEIAVDGDMVVVLKEGRAEAFKNMLIS